jgi:RNA polymerase sigma factor (sigma-70 family)
MVDDKTLNDWFVREVLPLEPSLASYIRRNWRSADDLGDLRQEIYERVLIGAQKDLPQNARGYLFTTARNHLINKAMRARIVSFEQVSDMENIGQDVDMFDLERHLTARDELRWALEALNQLPPRCREVVSLRKVEGLPVSEITAQLGISKNTAETHIKNGLRAIAEYMLGGTGKVQRRPSRRAAAGEREQ